MMMKNRQRLREDNSFDSYSKNHSELRSNNRNSRIVVKHKKSKNVQKSPFSKGRRQSIQKLKMKLKNKNKDSDRIVRGKTKHNKIVNKPKKQRNILSQIMITGYQRAKKMSDDIRRSKTPVISSSRKINSNRNISSFNRLGKQFSKKGSGFDSKNKKIFSDEKQYDNYFSSSSRKINSSNKKLNRQSSD